MGPTRRFTSGYSLIELLVVFAIVGVLFLAGAVMIGNRNSNAVRSVMDEIEGVLANAQKTAVVTSNDVYVSTAGTWADGNLVLDGRPLNTATVHTPLTSDDIKAGNDVMRLGSSSECFRFHSGDRDHQYAGVDCGVGWYAAALGSASDLKDVEPVKSDIALVSAMGTRLFTGANATDPALAGSSGYIIVNGLTRRFEKGFSIVVAGLRAGSPVPNGSVGVIIVPAKSSSIYKFYKPDGSTTWRRL